MNQSVKLPQVEMARINAELNRLEQLLKKYEHDPVQVGQLLSTLNGIRYTMSVLGYISLYDYHNKTWSFVGVWG